jgi:hypothetical protein
MGRVAGRPGSIQIEEICVHRPPPEVIGDSFPFSGANGQAKAAKYGHLPANGVKKG